MFSPAISTPIKWFFGIMIGIPLLLILAQLALVLFDYSIERLWLNRNLKFIMSQIEESGGLASYDVNGATANIRPYRNSNAVNGTADPLAQTKRTLNDVCAGLEHVQSNLTGINGSGTIIEGQDSLSQEDMDFFVKTNYSLEVDFNEVSYVGSEVKIVLHRDIAFKMLWGIPWIMHLQEEGSYVHDTQYTPSDGYSREGGAAYIVS